MPTVNEWSLFLCTIHLVLLLLGIVSEVARSCAIAERFSIGLAGFLTRRP